MVPSPINSMNLCHTASVLALVLGLQAWTLTCQDLACHPSDLDALKGFSSCLNPSAPIWNVSNPNCCSWSGVTCDNSATTGKRVIALELGSQRLTGSICEPLTSLDQLRILNLSHNNFYFGFPSGFLQFQRLEVLDLSNNYFHGNVLESSHLPLIQYVDISRNRFGGSLDATARLCRASHYVQVLNLGYNFFSGEVPDGFRSCHSLQQLFLNGNNLSGSFPGSVLKLQGLRVLQLQGNLFSGPLDHGIGNLSNLVELDVSQNSFYGSLPDVFGELGKLENLSVSSNRFSGQIPKSLVNSPSLVIVNLNNNSFAAININCSAMISLVSLDLGSNYFEGTIPTSLSSCKKLRRLNLSKNKLRGELPSSFKNLQALTHLSLSNNSLTNLSAALGTLQHCSNLTLMIIGLNFRGEDMANDASFVFRNLKVLVIPYCQLSGTLPDWLKGCESLQVIDLSWNYLEGYVPPWIGNFKDLFYLDLSNNSLVGQIPRSVAELPAFIDKNESAVSDSNVTLYKNQGGLHLTYIKVSSFPPTLDLSHNKLTGPIWPSFGNLKQLQVLNLEQNELSGPIPDSLSGMTNIEVLDLSYNDLSGEIPSSLAKLSFLSKFSVAYNQLHGKIPTGGQLMTFPSSSFVGNEGMCNEAFGIPCQPAQVDSSSEEIHIFGLPFGLGAATSFLLTVAFCFISGWVFPKSRRKNASKGAQFSESSSEWPRRYASWDA